MGGVKRGGGGVAVNSLGRQPGYWVRLFAMLAHRDITRYMGIAVLFVGWDFNL